MCMTWNYQVVLSKKVLSTLCKLPSCLNSLKPSMSKRSKCTTQWSTVSTSISGAVNLFHHIGGTSGWRFWCLARHLYNWCPAFRMLDPSGCIVIGFLLSGWVGSVSRSLYFKTRLSVPCRLDSPICYQALAFEARDEVSSPWFGCLLAFKRRARLPDCFCSGLSLSTRMMADELQLSKRLWSSHPLWCCTARHSHMDIVWGPIIQEIN